MKVKELNIYPIKSCAPIKSKELNFNSVGAKDDRSMLIVDKNGRFLTQREFPKMCQITPILREGKWTVHAPEMPEMFLKNEIEDIKYKSETGIRKINIWKDEVLAYEFDRNISQWFSDFLKIECSLVQMGDKSHRPYSLESREISFVDHSPLLIITSASLEALNSKLSSPIPMDRFRPSIVIDNVVLPFLEDSWRMIKLGNMTLNFARECTRCIMICIDQVTAEVKSGPLKTLSTFRKRLADNKIIFGSYYYHQGVGKIEVGDKLTVLSPQS